MQRKVVIDPWDIIEGFRNPPGVNAPPPIPWSYFSAVRVDRKLLTAESNASQAAWHSHTLIKPAEYFLEAPPLPAEEDLPVARTPGGGMLMDEPATSETASVDTASPRSPRSARAPKPKKAAAGQGRFRFQFWTGKKNLSFIWLHLTLALRWNSFIFSIAVWISFCNEHDLSKNRVKIEWRTQLDENRTHWLQLGQKMSPFGRGKLCTKCSLHDGVSKTSHDGTHFPSIWCRKEARWLETAFGLKQGAFPWRVVRVKKNTDWSVRLPVRPTTVSSQTLFEDTALPLETQGRNKISKDFSKNPVTIWKKGTYVKKCR